MARKLAQMRIENLREVIKDLRAVDAALPKEIKERAKAAADQMIPDAQGFYRGHYTQRTGKHASRIRAFASARGDASLKGGGAKYPEFAGQEFGSSGTYPQFVPAAADLEGGTGRFLWRAAIEGMEEFVEEIQDGLTEVLHKAGFKKGGFI